MRTVSSMRQTVRVLLVGLLVATGMNAWATPPSTERSRPWDPLFLVGLSHATQGDSIHFELVGGQRASGTIQHMARRAGEVIRVAGDLSQPEEGRFFFQKQTRPGLAGAFVGVVEFPSSGSAFRIEATGPGGASQLVKRSMEEVLCVNLPWPSAGIGDPVAIPPLNPGDFPDVLIPEYQHGIVVLESRHGAVPVLYLDFQGGHTPTWGGVTYARPELSNDQIRAIWLLVSEDFMPFDLNVTTDMRIFQQAPEGSRQRIIITPTTFMGTDYGGVAYTGSFNWTEEVPCWAFMLSGKACAEVCSHELGHTMGLKHSGLSSAGSSSSYYSGHGTGETGWAPIMGVGYYQNVTQWSQGEYLHADSHEDQLAVLTTLNNQVDYRADDTGESLATSRHLELYPDCTASGEGVIERTGDTDTFQFTTGGGMVVLRVNPVSAGPNLALKLSLRDANEVTVATDEPQSTLGGALATNIPAGTYTLCVSGAGRRSPSTNGFSSYGSLGYYSITGSVANARLPDRFAVTERATNGTVVGIIHPRLSNGHPLEYSIVSGNESNTFAVDHSGVLTVADNRLLDFVTLANRSQFPVQFELFVNLADQSDPGLTETNRRVVVAILFLAEPPVIFEQPQSLTVEAGRRAAFSVAGGPEQTLFVPLRYQWFLNGAAVADATGTALGIQNAQAIHAGDYTVVLTNSAGAVTSAVARLTVTPVLPFFTREPLARAVVLHSTASFLASAIGTEPISYQWQLGGKDLSGRTSTSLFIWDCTFTDAGSYRIIASNSVGTVASSTALLDVRGLLAWGSNESGATQVPALLTNAVQVSAGARHNLVLLRDGRVVAWGMGEQTNVPPGLTGVIAVAAGGSHSLALIQDGTITAWGGNGAGQADVPEGLSNVVGIAAGHGHSLALKADGTVAAWGENGQGQCDVPLALSNVVAISAGRNHSLALTGDGNVLAWGDNRSGQVGVPASLNQVVAISAGGQHNLALKADGSVCAWGDNSCGQIAVPAGLSRAVAVCAGNSQSLVVCEDGSLCGWGGGFAMPAGAANIVAVATGESHNLALVGDGPPFITEPPVGRAVNVNSRVSFRAAATGTLPLYYQWQFAGTNLAGATGPVLIVDRANASGEYRVVVSNTCGVAISPPATLAVDPRPWVLVQPLSQGAGLGSRLELQITAEGVGPLYYQWRFEGIDLAQQTNCALVLENITFEQAGEYTVLVSNAHGSVSSTGAVLTVQQVVAWGDNRGGQTNVPPGLTGVVQLAGGGSHSLAVRADGTVVAWGSMDADYGQARVPPGVTNAIAVAAGRCHSLALKADGTVTAWGAGAVKGAHPHYGQSIVPFGLTNVVAIAACGYLSAALKDNGQVVLWGDYSHGPPDAEAVAVAAGFHDCAYLTADSSIIDRGSGISPPPGTDLIEIAPRVSLSADGNVFVAPGFWQPPDGLSNVVEVAAGDFQVLVRKADGGVETWGDPSLYGLVAAMPVIGTNVIAVGCGPGHSLVALGEGSLQITSQPCDRKAEVGGKTLFRVRAAGRHLLHYQWQFNETDLPGATNGWLRLVDLALTNGGGYSVVVSDSSGSITSRVARLSVGGLGMSLRSVLNAPGLIWATGGDKPWFCETNATHDRVSAAQSGFIVDGQKSSLETVVVGPGSLSFWWKVSSEEPFDRLEFAINRSVEAALCGEVNWRCERFNVPAGACTLSWTYAKDTYSSAGWDAAWLDQVAYLTNAPAIKEHPVDVVLNGGSSFLLSVGVSAAPPIYFQWQRNGINLPGATDCMLRVENCTRHDSGQYAVAVSNPGGTTLSSNAQVVVRVPQRLICAGLQSDTGFQLLSRDADGEPLNEEDLALFEAQTSTNLVHWTTLSNCLSLCDGALLLVDPQDAGSHRFYRILER